MNKEIAIRHGIQVLFFACWDASIKQQDYHQRLHAMFILAEAEYPDVMKELREENSWSQWNQQRNDPERYFPQQIADDVVLHSFTHVFLREMVFYGKGDWHLEVEGNVSKIDGKINRVYYRYANILTEEVKNIGSQTFHVLGNLPLEIRKHLNYLAEGNNPFEVDCE
ncbi:hypothetical protein MZD04_gp141 [Pseudomonas phage Psa21]|uniref:Uncharacterized protein n=1 Tax=Pseudomonas phage Psa21 TaxID=2530023 RepID=A0A481W4T9_9CAUD|nr:hypothetical protein MZD04_gp141 [Pseudomonas phage Psa21]QBJ02668.1 hypothetical protein PSA21_141 [Pseudomonas phage Psa21]